MREITASIQKKPLKLVMRFGRLKFRSGSTKRDGSFPTLVRIGPIRLVIILGIYNS